MRPGQALPTEQLNELGVDEVVSYWLSVSTVLGPSYMVSGTRDNPTPELPWPR